MITKFNSYIKEGYADIVFPVKKINNVVIFKNKYYNLVEINEDNVRVLKNMLSDTKLYCYIKKDAENYTRPQEGWAETMDDYLEKVCIITYIGSDYINVPDYENYSYNGNFSFAIQSVLILQEVKGTDLYKPRKKENYLKESKEEVDYDFLVDYFTGVFHRFKENGINLYVSNVYRNQHTHNFELLFNNDDSEDEILFITIDNDHKQIRYSNNSYRKNLHYNDLSKVPFEDYKKVEKDLEKGLVNFYSSEELNDYDYDLIQVPIINFDKWLDFIYKDVLEDIKGGNEGGKFDEFMRDIYNSDYLKDKKSIIYDKFKHLIDAKNFDLL